MRDRLAECPSSLGQRLASGWRWLGARCRAARQLLRAANGTGPLLVTQIGATVLTKTQKLVMYVDGKPYTGNPRSIVLAAHTLVVLEVTPPTVTPPPTFTFPAGL